MSSSLSQAFEISARQPAPWLGVCAGLGLPVPPLLPPDATPEAGKALWLQPPPAEPDPAAGLAVLLACLQREPQADAQAWQLPAAAETLACVRLEADYSEDLVQTETEAFALPRLHSGPHTTGFRLQLQQLIDTLRCALGDRDWLLHVAQSADQLWLLGVFPWGWQATPGAWYAGSQLDLPLQTGASLLSLEVLKQAAGDWLEVLDPEVPTGGFDWLESLGGQLCFSAPAFEARLGWRLTEPAPLRPQDIWSLWRWPARSKAALEQIWQTFRVPRSSLSGALAHWREMLRHFLPIYFEGLRSIAQLCALLESRGLLADYLALNVSPASRMGLELRSLRDSVQQVIINQQGELPTVKELLRYPAFQRSWQLFLSQYGQFCPGGLDLEPRRFSDQSSALIRLLMRPWGPEAVGVDTHWQHTLWQPLWGELKRLLQTRDTLLSDTLWALQQLRQQMQSLAQAQVEAGALHETADIWWLWPHEIDSLQPNTALAKALHDLSTERRARFADWRQCWQQAAAPCPPESSLQGTGLRNGLRQGQIWRCSGSFDSLPTLPEGWQPENSILLADHIDPGWMPALLQVGGVILTGSAIGQTAASLLREMGLPTVLACPAAAGLRQGQRVRLNAETGSIHCLD
ncbi:MAG: hypothetical protein IGS03_16450 [Candidatus Sericytochromatia bacterium]|nr:hypothetical protein [Candidatus Sericytochromatia bacterium]